MMGLSTEDALDQLKKLLDRGLNLQEALLELSEAGTDEEFAAAFRERRAELVKQIAHVKNYLKQLEQAPANDSTELLGMYDVADSDDEIRQSFNRR